MPAYREIASTVRVLAITHVLVGALAIIFGMADGVKTTKGSYLDPGVAAFGFFVVWAGIWVSVHCRNSAFVRYNLTALFSRPSSRSLVAIKIGVKTSLNHGNRFQFPRLKAFGRVFILRSGLECNRHFSYLIKFKCL